MNSHPYFQWQHSFHKITHINVYTPIHELLRAPLCDPHSIALHTPHQEDRGICPSGPLTVAPYMQCLWLIPLHPGHGPVPGQGKASVSVCQMKTWISPHFTKIRDTWKLADLHNLRSANLNYWPWLPLPVQTGWGVLFGSSWWPPVLFFMSQRTPDLAVTWSSRKEQSQPHLQLVLYM